MPTDRHGGIRQKDGPGEETCRYANEASAVSDSTLGGRLSKAQGRAGGFFLSNRQASFSTPVETGHCHLSLSSWAVASILEQEMECGIMTVMSRITVMGQ